MEILLQWLMLALAVGLGWALGYAARKKKNRELDPSLSSGLTDRLKILFETHSEEAIGSFVQSLEVNAETVGMHLSIGSYFRKSGEVEKAILVHQNLMSRPEIPKLFNDEVIFELAKDYMAAGLLDRAEALFLQVKASKSLGDKSLKWLIDIYQQEKEWLKAREVALSIQALKGREVLVGANVSLMLAHFSCELAEECSEQHDYWEARNRLREALSFDKRCVRANLLLADMHMRNGHYSEAVTILRKVEGQDDRFLSEVIPRLVECSLQMKSEDKLRQYLQSILAKKSLTSVILGVSESYNREQGVKGAGSFLIDQLVSKPSLRGLDRLVDYQLAEAASNSDIRHLQIIKQVTQSLLVGKPAYQCTACGFSGGQLHWQCPSCKKWGQVAPISGVDGE